MSDPRRVVVLGSTGSIGRQALAVMAPRLGRFQVTSLAAGGGQVELLADQAAAVGASTVAVADPAAAEPLEARLAARGMNRVEVLAGPQAAAELAGRGGDMVLNAITGYAGLDATLAALAAGSLLALANKESLVVGGPLVLRAARPGQIVPVDSEHSAIAQALRSGRADEVRRLILTASGGPFLGRDRSQLAQVTPQQALAHPTWRMGRVVTINSATLVNKGLELIEAATLFGLPYDAITVVVHPQSVVHSMVEFHDGATLAQASPPDMSLPIGLALAWPERLADVARPCRWDRATAWSFQPVDNVTFPAVELARRAGQAGGIAPAVLNGANEVLVDAFCAGSIGFLDIVDGLAQILERHLAGRTASAPAGVSAGVSDKAPSGRPGRLAACYPDSPVESGPGPQRPRDGLTLEAVRAGDWWARRQAAAQVAGKG
jgi:1-deoxy-D-xylulose-5-phosphate reductoisomerase